jgi:uncharacterized protein YodC (DUF2158 family)
MSEINDGGPAFPVLDLSKTQSQGMTMRDWFAGMALQGMMAVETPDCHYVQPSDAAQWAYKYADAMLKAREKQ